MINFAVGLVLGADIVKKIGVKDCPGFQALGSSDVMLERACLWLNSYRKSRIMGFV